MKKDVVIPIFVGVLTDFIMSGIGVLYGMIDYDLLSYRCYNCLIIILLTIVFVGAYYIYSLRKKTNIDTIPKYKKVGKCQHPILIIDDDEQSLKKLKAFIQDTMHNVVSLRDLSDERLVDQFEIIVSDIKGIGSVDDAQNLLNRIKEVYPYKILIPVSSGNTKIENADVETISKDGNHYQKILNEVKNFQNILDDPRLHWTEVSLNLQKRRISSERIEKIKEDYITFLTRQTEK